MATINVHQAKDGTKAFRVRVRRKGEPTQTASFSSLRDARQWATMIEGEIIAGKHFPTKKSTHTLNELLDKYVQEIMPRKTEETQRSHRGAVMFWRERLGHKLLTDITKADIIPLRNERSMITAPATVQKYLTILSHAFNTAIKEYGWLDANVVNTVSRPPLPPGRLRYLSDEERSRLLQECQKSQNPYLYPLVILALATGLRRGSLFNLTTARVDVAQGILYLDKTKNRSRLALPLVGEALTCAHHLCTTSSDGYVFPRGSGNPWCHYRTSWEHAVARAKLQDFSFHCLRHTAASYLVQAGVPLYTVGAILGHSSRSTAMTARYAHLATDNLREALETLSQRLSS
jgi:integrase